MFERIASTPSLWEPTVHGLLHADDAQPPDNITSGCHEGYACAQNIASLASWWIQTNASTAGLVRHREFLSWYFRYLRAQTDPATGLWRQVWMSPRFHIDYSGGLDETGAMVLEGRLHSNADGSEMQVRGVWAPQEDGSVRQEFWVRPDDRSDWAPLFVGYTRRR